jgi:hypothetical protein
MASRNVKLHEDNKAVVYILPGLTSCSPVMLITELRKLWHLVEVNGVNIRAGYLRSTANVSTDASSTTTTNTSIWCYSRKLNSRFDPHTIDRFAFALIRLLPRYNSGWLDQ